MFYTDLIYVESGDRIWWDWVTEEVGRAFYIMEVEKCISPIGGRLAIENEAAGEYRNAMCNMLLMLLTVTVSVII